MLDILRWALAIPFGAFGCLVIACNYACVLSSRSLIPVLGGTTLAAGMLICPLPKLAFYFWVPAVLDPGCVLTFVLLTIDLFRRQD
jgi:hypothetical protein